MPYPTKRIRQGAALGLMLLLTAALCGTVADADDTGKLRVVTSLPDYAWVAEEIGGDLAEVHTIARGNQDAHFIRPRPSYQALIKNADILVTTGLDLELWMPTLLDAAGNPKVLEGGPGYVTAYPGIELLDVPESADRSKGDIHIFGNPHIHTDPLNMVFIARNVLAGFERVDPDRAEVYRERERILEDKIHRRLFGDELVEMIGGDALARLARGGKLRGFLETKEFPRGSGRMLVDRLGGWMKKTEPLRGTTFIGYHTNWVYFANRFEMEIAGYIETKPGIPPTPRHVGEIIELMQGRGIRTILSANYFEPTKPRMIAERTGGTAVIVPLSTGGAPGVDTYWALIDTWLEGLLAAKGKGVE